MSRIREREKVQPFESELELRTYISMIRKQFKEIFNRDVPGYFIRKLAQQCGLTVELPESTKAKMAFAFDLMDRNVNYRTNRTDLARALELNFDEKTLGYIVDDIWEEWHGRDVHPHPTEDVDTHGQEALFE